MYKLLLGKNQANNILWALDTAIKDLDRESDSYDSRLKELEALRDRVEEQFGINKGAPVA